MSIDPKFVELTADVVTTFFFFTKRIQRRSRKKKLEFSDDFGSRSRVIQKPLQTNSSDTSVVARVMGHLYPVACVANPILLSSFKATVRKLRTSVSSPPPKHPSPSGTGTGEDPEYVFGGEIYMDLLRVVMSLKK